MKQERRNVLVSTRTWAAGALRKRATRRRRRRRLALGYDERDEEGPGRGWMICVKLP